MFAVFQAVRQETAGSTFAHTSDRPQRAITGLSTAKAEYKRRCFRCQDSKNHKTELFQCCGQRIRRLADTGKSVITIQKTLTLCRARHKVNDPEFRTIWSKYEGCSKVLPGQDAQSPSAVLLGIVLVTSYACLRD